MKKRTKRIMLGSLMGLALICSGDRGLVGTMASRLSGSVDS